MRVIQAGVGGFGLSWLYAVRECDGFEHVALVDQVLASERLVTERSAYVMRGKDGTLVEVFEWLSADAIAAAHSNAAVAALWAEFAAVCDYVPLATLAESQQMFAEFESVVL